MGRNLVRSLLSVLTILSITLIAVGCQSHISPVVANPHHKWFQVPTALASFADTLTVLCVLATLAVAGAIALFIWLPANRISILLGEGAAAILGISLFLKVTLWTVPWVAGALCLAAVAALVYEIYERVHTGKFVNPESIFTDQQSAVESIAASVV